MINKILLPTLIVLSCLSGCASVSSSSAQHVPESEQVSGEIYITMSAVPMSLGYEIIGHVKANARKGYGSVESLYPLLAEKAKKVGANAVINVKGGRAPAAFSWAAPFTGGTAIKIDDIKKLEKYNGGYYN